MGTTPDHTRDDFGIVWATDRSDGSGSPEPSENPGDRAHVALLERLFAADCCVETASVSTRYSAADHARSQRVAEAHPEIEKRIRAGARVIAADQTWPRSRDGRRAVTATVHLIDYARSMLTEVALEDDRVAAIRDKAVHEYPETANEVAIAIRVARTDPRIADQVRGLDAHGILRVPTFEGDPSRQRRCIWLTFTDPEDDPARELSARFTALVDIGDRSVLWCGPGPCGPVDAEREVGAAS